MPHIEKNIDVMQTYTIGRDQCVFCCRSGVTKQILSGIEILKKTDI